MSEKSLSEYFPVPAETIPKIGAQLPLDSEIMTTLRQESLSERAAHNDTWGGPEFYHVPNIGTVYLYDVQNPTILLGHMINKAHGREDTEHSLPPEEIINTANEHFAKIQSLGLLVVSHAFGLRTDLTDEDQNNTTVPQLMSATVLLNDTSPILNTPSSEIDFDELVNTVIEPAQKYVEWVLESNQPFFLRNILNSYEYRHDKSTGALLFDKPEPDLWHTAEGNDRMLRDDYIHHFTDNLLFHYTQRNI